jgi:hypothetical protein
MCPVCISTAALMVASASSTGGLTAVVLKKLLGSKSEREPAYPGFRNGEEQKPR